MACDYSAGSSNSTVQQTEKPAEPAKKAVEWRVLRDPAALSTMLCHIADNNMVLPQSAVACDF